MDSQLGLEFCAIGSRLPLPRSSSSAGQSAFSGAEHLPQDFGDGDRSLHSLIQQKLSFGV